MENVFFEPTRILRFGEESLQSAKSRIQRLFSNGQFFRLNTWQTGSDSGSQEPLESRQKPNARVSSVSLARGVLTPL
jgi:hypothetical protein